MTVSRFFNRILARSNKPERSLPQRRRSSLQLETLEAREVMSATIMQTGDTLYVQGTSGDDNIAVEQFGFPSLPSFRITSSGNGSQPTVQEWSPFVYPYVNIRQRVQRVQIEGYGGNDTLDASGIQKSVSVRNYGGDGNDRIHGGQGSDYTSGGNGNDTIFDAWGRNYIDGGFGNDYVMAGSGNNTLVGGYGNDTLYGSTGDDVLYGGYGKDRLYGHLGNDHLDGGFDDDVLYGSAGDDVLHGADGNDKLYGDDDNDVLSGGAGKDRLEGGSGWDKFTGGYGDDTFVGGAGNDWIEEASYTDVTVGKRKLKSVKGTDSFAEIEHIVVSATGSGITMDATDSPVSVTFYGGNGNDKLYGSSHTDWLFGGNGNDGLYGGPGKDYLHGENGADRFLVMENDIDVVVDGNIQSHGEDARITFKNVKGHTKHNQYKFGDKNWTTKAIRKVDVALANLQDITGNAKLLKRADGGELTLSRVGDQLNLLPTWWGKSGSLLWGWNSGGDITLTGNAFDSNQQLWATIYHEIAHNWDTQSENKHIGQFRVISGWIASDNKPKGYKASTKKGDRWFYRKDASFARDYGKSNPKEDYATTWETYFMKKYHGTKYGNKAVQEKLDNLDKLFADLRS